MNEQFLILISAGLVSNLILDHMLGVDPVLAVSRKIEPAVDLSILMLLVLPVTTSGAYLLNSLVLIPFELAYLRITGLVMLTSLLVLITAWLTSILKPSLFTRIEMYIPLVLVNGAVLGVALLNIESQPDFMSSISFGIGSALGFGLLILIISAIRDKIAAADVPAPFRGIPLLLTTLGLMSMAFMGFAGIGSNI